jgi:hypothetical protein
LSTALALDITDFFEALPNGGCVLRVWRMRRSGTKPDHRHRRLLRARRERPDGRRAADERYEGAALHSITSSAA